MEKQRRPAAAAAVAHEEAAAGPMAALTLAAHAAAGAGQQQGRWHVPDEESTLDLMAQVLVSRRQLADEHTAELGNMGAGVAGPLPLEAAASQDGEQQDCAAPTTAALLSRAMGSGTAAALAAAASSEQHPISSLRADDPLTTAAAAAADVPQSFQAMPRAGLHSLAAPGAFCPCTQTCGTAARREHTAPAPLQWLPAAAGPAA